MPEVLIVDDDPDIRAMLRYSLGEHGFTIREASDGAAALAVLDDQPPDVMVLDLMMPIVDGFSVLEAMRTRGIAPNTKVIILSAKGEERDFVKGWELGASDYLTKPLDPDQLAVKIHLLLAVATGRRAS